MDLKDKSDAELKMSEEIKCPYCGVNLAECPEHLCTDCGNFFVRLKAEFAVVQKRIGEVKAVFMQLFGEEDKMQELSEEETEQFKQELEQAQAQVTNKRFNELHALLAEKKKEIERLRTALEIIERNIKAGTVNLFWVRDFITKTLKPQGDKSAEKESQT